MRLRKNVGVIILMFFHGTVKSVFEKNHEIIWSKRYFENLYILQ